LLGGGRQGKKKKSKEKDATRCGEGGRVTHRKKKRGEIVLYVDAIDARKKGGCGRRRDFTLLKGRDGSQKENDSGGSCVARGESFRGN